MAAFKRRAAALMRSEAGGDTEEEPMTNKLSGVFQSDGSRTAQYMQYIRALNTQFTSWVQQQLKEHPFELWREGIQDYMQHASKIEDDFKDVTASCTPSTTSIGIQLEPVSSPSNAVPSLHGGSSSGGVGKSIFESKGSFSDTQACPSSTAVPFSNVTPSGSPFLNIPGSASTCIPNIGDDTQENDDAPQEPSSPSVKRSEEPGIRILHEIKCKLYSKGGSTTNDAWKEMGMGNLTVRSREGVDRSSKEAKATILVRDEVGRVLLNALLYPNIKMNIQKNKVTGIFHSAETDIKTQDSKGADTVKARLYLFRLKTENDAEQLVEVITANTPSGE